jgi:hypothetical protein
MADSHGKNSQQLREKFTAAEASTQGLKEMDCKDEKAAAFSARMHSMRRHDVFNLFAIGVLNALNFWFLWFGSGAFPPTIS